LQRSLHCRLCRDATTPRDSQAGSSSRCLAARERILSRCVLTPTKRHRTIMFSRNMQPRRLSIVYFLWRLPRQPLPFFVHAIGRLSPVPAGDHCFGAAVADISSCESRDFPPIHPLQVQPESGRALRIKSATESTSRTKRGEQDAERKRDSKASKTGSRRLELPVSELLDRRAFWCLETDGLFARPTAMPPEGLRDYLKEGKVGIGDRAAF
jgi:hypothetical protein